MAGIAGLVLAVLALADQLRSSEPSEGRQMLLIMSAVLLSVSFVLAPVVRRAFDVLPASRARGERKTLLDEMREQPEGEWSERAHSDALATVPQETSARRWVARVITALYVVFALVLVGVVFTM